MILGADGFFDKRLVKGFAIDFEIIVKLFKLGHIVQVGPIAHNVARRLNAVVVERLVDFDAILNVPLLLQIIDYKGLAQSLVGNCFFEWETLIKTI